MEEQDVSCSRVSGAVPDAPVEADQVPAESASQREVPRMVARVGQKAPDFAAPAYYQGSFTNVKLSDFAGKWVMLCFYPGDFTFV